MNNDEPEQPTRKRRFTIPAAGDEIAVPHIDVEEYSRRIMERVQRTQLPEESVSQVLTLQYECPLEESQIIKLAGKYGVSEEVLSLLSKARLDGTPVETGLGTFLLEYSIRLQGLASGRRKTMEDTRDDEAGGNLMVIIEARAHGELQEIFKGKTGEDGNQLAEAFLREVKKGMRVVVKSYVDLPTGVGEED